MDIFLLINFIFSFAIFAYVLSKIFRKENKLEVSKVMKNLFSIGFLYLLFSCLSILWFTEVFNYSLQDFNLIFAIFLFLQNLVLYRVVHLFARNKKIFYFLLMYAFVAVSFIFNFDFTFVFTILSFLVSLLLFVSFIFRFDEYRKVGYLGIIYSSLGILGSIFSILGVLKFTISSAILLVFLFATVFLLVRDLRKFPFLRSLKFSRKRSAFLIMLGHFIFIVAFINFILIGTLVVHEFGHFTASKFNDCDYQKIVYENNFLHTEISCFEDKANSGVILGGVLLPLIIAILLFFLGGPLMREIGILMFGFNLVSVSRDLVDLGLHQSFIFIIMAFGIIILTYGIYLLTTSRMEEEIYFPSTIQNNEVKST